MLKRDRNGNPRSPGTSGPSRQLPLERETDTPNLPSTQSGVHQGGGTLEASLEEMGIKSTGTMFGRFGAAQRRHATSTYSYIMDRQIKPAFRPVLRLRYR